MSDTPSVQRALSWTRYRPPAPQPGTLDRPRLVARLDERVRRQPVTVVTAPSGFGKSLAVSAWAAARTGPVAWLSLTAFDSDPTQLGLGVLRALQSAARVLEEGSALELLASEPQTYDAAEAYRAVSEALDGDGRDVVLVVDDAQRAADALTTGLLGALLDAALPRLRIVLVGTAYLEVGLSRYLLSHPDAALGADELAFTEDEVAALAVRQESPATAADVFAETQGWPIAARLMLLGVASLPDAGTWRTGTLLRDYVRDHVLGQLPDRLARFVLDATVSAEISAELAAEVTGLGDAQALLEECVRLGLFLDRFDTPHGPVYRWHSAFSRQCAMVRSARDPARDQELHRRAARALAQTEPLAAMQHWTAAGHGAEAVRVLLEYWVRLVLGPDTPAVDRACAGLPERFRDDPRVLLVRACAQDVMGEHAAARTLLAQVEGAAAGGADGIEHTLALARLLLLDDRAEIGRASAAVRRALAQPGGMHVADRAGVYALLGWTELRYRTHPDLLVELLRSAVRESEAVGDTWLARRAAGQLAMALAWSGRLTAARETAARAGLGVEDTGTPWGSFGAGAAATAASMAAYLADEVDEAMQLASRVVLSGSARTSFAGVARMNLALAAAASKDPRARRRAAQELQIIPRQDSHGISWVAFRHVSVAALEEAAGHRDRAVAIARRYLEVDNLPLVLVVLAGILRRAGDPGAALHMLRGMRAYAEISYVKVATLATTAVVRRRRGETEQAHELCERALEVAASEQVRRPLCDGDVEMRQLLTEHIAWGTRFEAFAAGCLAARTPRGPLDALSGRELEVFEQMRTTKTMQEIADALGLSINTVKTHQRAIYRKLKVASRREAVRLMV